MDPPVRKRGRPRKEEQPKRGRPKANVDVTRKSATSQSFDTEKEKKVENINASEQKISGEIKTRSAAVKNSASSKLRPPKPPPYTNKEKWNRMNNGQKLYAMRQYNLSLIRRGLPVDKTLPGSFNFKSSNFTFSAIPYGSVKKPKISDSNFAKNTQPNTVIKPKSSDSSRSKNDQPDSTLVYEIIPSANLDKTKSLDLKQIDDKIEKIEKALGLKKAENKLEKREKSDSKKVENKLRKTDKSLVSKKIENKESGKKLEASEKAPPRKKIDPVSEDESSDDSDSETEESGTEREMPDLDLYKAEEKQPSTQKEIQIPNLSVSTSEKIGSKKVMKVSGLSSSKGNLKEIQAPDLSSNSEKIGTKKEMKHSGLSSAKGTQKEIQTSDPSGSDEMGEKMGTKKEMKDSGLNSGKILGTIKKIPILNHAAVENKQSESAKKTDVKIRTSVYTFTTKCDRQRRSTGILTKKPISVVSPKKISTITMKYRERNRKATKPDEIPTLSKEVDTAGNDSNVIIIQKKVPEKQNLANTSNSLKTKHGANSNGTVPAKKLSETVVEYQEQKKSSPDVKQFLEDSNVKKNDAEVIAVVKEEPVSPSSSLPNTSSLHINNSEGAKPVEKLSITEMECKEQRNSNPDERQLLEDPNGKGNAAEVAIVKEEQEEPERPISSLLHVPSVVQKNNPESIMAVQSIPTVEMTLEKQSTSTTNPSGRSSRLSIRVKSIDSSSLETNSDGSPSTLSLIRQILEDQNPRMINPYVCPSDVSVVKIPVKISRLSRSQNSKITNSIGNPLVTEKLDCQESTPIVIKEEPQKEESESQNLLKNKTCLNSEDTKNTSDVMTTGSISDVLDHETERVESVGEINLDVSKTNSTSDILDHDKERIESIGETNLDVLKTNSTSDILEHDTERIELVEKTNLDVLDNDSPSDVLEHIEKHADIIASVEDTNLDIVKNDFTSVVLEPEIKGAASAEEVELDKAILNSPEDISNVEFCEKKDEEKELSIAQLNNIDAQVSEVETNELEATKATESDIGKIVDLEAIDSNLTDTTETEESDMVTEEIPQILETVTETDNMDIRENTKVKMQSYEEAVLHFPEKKCKSFQALKDNNLDSSLHSTRMYKKLPECVVVLHRLTEEDLHKSYPSESEDNYGISYDVKRKTDELCETVEGMDASERRDGNFRIVRRIPRSNASAFELYKQKRERYMNRRNRAYHSENSLDMSQDESRTFSDGAKPKKKLKRGRRYERDFEWRPDIPKGILNSDRKLRRRTSVIESDSSSSSDDDDEEFMYNLYIGYDDPYGNEETASSNAVPSDDTSSTAASNNCELEKQPSDKYSSSHQNSSQSSELKSASQSVDPGSFDIVSGIIKNMENQHHSKLKTSYNTSQHSKTKQSNDFIKTEQKKRKRPRMPSRKDNNSEIDPNKIVASILKEMVNKVSSKLKKCPEKQINKASKICKWCTTPFQPNRSSDVKCAICTDLGNGEVNKSLSSNKKSPNTLKIKCFKENKGKKTNSAMSKVLKKLSENEKQRLIYSEKSDTKTSGKGYNHCKSFFTPKDTISKSESDVNLNTSQNKTPNKLSLKGNKISTKLNQKNYKSDVSVNNNKCDKTEIKPVIRIKPNIPANVEKSQNKPNKNYDENKQNKSRVSLEKKNDGLFLMTFPDPDEEIDFDDKRSQSQVSKSGTSSESANNLISKQSTTTESSSQSMKQSQSVNMKKYDTYLFPPIPTVIVSNYCSDTSSLNLSHTYFQNEITHQHAIKNSTTLANTVNSNPVISLNNTVASISNTIAYQNSSMSTNFTSNNSTPIRTFPFNTNNQMKSILNTEAPNSVNNISILPKPSVPAGSSTVLSKPPISLSNVTISNLLSKTPVPASMAVLPNMSISANTVTILPQVSVPSNSVTILPKSSSSITMLPIVTSVISLSDKNAALTYKIKENLPSSFSSENFVNSLLSEIKINNVTSLKDDQSLLNSEPATYKDINKRLPSDTDENASFENKSHSSAKRKKLNSERFSSDYSEPSDREDVTKKSIAIEKDNPDNLRSNNQPSDSPEKEKSTESNSNDQKEQESSGSKESDKSSDDKEKTTPQSAISVTQSAIDLLGAISILAVIDLEQNPQKGLNVRIQVAKSQLNKLTSEKISTPEHNERIASCQYNLTLLNIAKKYLSIYGTFAKVSDHLLRKANMANMIQIKKELHEEETNQSSCMFSQPTHLNSSFSDRQSDVSRTVQMSPVNNQMQNFTSSRSAAQTPINHIEKLKSQIAAMNNVNMNNVDLSQYGIFPGGGTIHHYPVEQIAALNHAVAAPAPMMPRNDCLGNESRETPSRGSGPRTPARPESAASQSEDTASLIQIKKEQFETTTSPSSQCAYAQNTTLPQISSQLPVMPEMPTLMPQHSIPNTPMHLPVSNANQAYTNQTNYSVHSSGMAPNRTVAYTHQTYSDMYLNVTSKPQMQITPATTSAEMRQNQQVLLGQQMYIQNGSGLCSKQAVPSVNNNQYVIRPPYTTANTGGTLIVNNTQVGQNALLTNVSNQQFYTSNQVSQLYYPPSAQMTCMPNNNMPAMITQDVTAAQVQQAESPEQMICAVCNKQATLRCKQCARVAYCNTACAKTYWHQKHKMECKPVGS